MARTAMAKRRKRNNIISYLAFAIVVVLITVIMMFQSRNVKNKLNDYELREQALGEQIAAEQARSEEIDEFEKYVQTKAYAEEQAQEKLGLVNEGEIIFRKE